MSSLVGGFLLFLSFALARGYDRDDCICGAMNTDVKRIVNGRETIPNKYPWMVALFDRNRKVYCGGALISDKHVLTAAHCLTFNPRNTSYWLDIYGKIRVHNVKDGERINFQKVHLHPKFLSFPQYNYDDYDLAILTIDIPIKTFSREVGPICVPKMTKQYDGLIGTVSGWGIQKNDILKASNVLRDGKLEILDQRDCPERTALRLFYNLQSMVCAFSLKHVDTCMGDSGGPLVVETSPNSYELVGISSFGASCGKSKAGVYASIKSPFSLGWIWNTIKTAGTCPRSH